jgi:hypothetical protein
VRCASQRHDTVEPGLRVVRFRDDAGSVFIVARERVIHRPVARGISPA